MNIAPGLLLVSTRHRTGYDDDTIFEIARGADNQVIRCCQHCNLLVVWSPKLTPEGRVQINYDRQIHPEDKWKYLQHSTMYLNISGATPVPGAW